MAACNAISSSSTSSSDSEVAVVPHDQELVILRHATDDEHHQRESCFMNRDVYNAAVCGLGSTDLCANWTRQKTPIGNNVLHVHVGKVLRKGEAAGSVKVSFIQYVLNNSTGQDCLLLETNDDKDTPLHLAARFGHAGVVEEFLKARPGQGGSSSGAPSLLLNKVNGNKDTALHDAARAGHAPVVRLLVEAASPGDSLQHMMMPNAVSETPLYLAAEKGCVESFAIILEACDRLNLPLDYQGPCGMTALHIAVLGRNQEIVSRILKTKSSLIRVQNNAGHTPLHCAAAAAAQNDEKSTILELLLNNDDEYNSAAYIQDNYGRTALHLATLNLNFQGVKMIINSYPDCIEIVDRSRKSVVHYAANLGCLHRFRQFLDIVSPSCDKLINTKDNKGDTPLHILAATSPSLPSHDCFVRLHELVKLYDYALDLKAHNRQNLTPGDIIASNSSLRHLAAAPPKEMCKILPRSQRTNHNGSDCSGAVVQEGNVSNAKVEEKYMNNLKRVEDKIINLKKANETRLVVSALIATVSFTAGFTVPGGFNQGPKDDAAGLALLVKNVAFEIFLVTDTIAFTLSSLAIICYFVVAKYDALVKVDKLSISGHLLSTVSLGALMAAFVTGVCAVVSHSPGLIVTVGVISLFFFIAYFALLLGTIGTLLAFMTRNSATNARE